MTHEEDVARRAAREMSDRLQSSASTDAGSQNDRAEPGHTPGPWFVGPHYKHDVESRDGRICECRPWGSPRAAANARLIAAAPDLLACVREMEGWIDPDEHGLTNRDEARAVEQRALAAIAKAEGR